MDDQDAISFPRHPRVPGPLDSRAASALLLAAGDLSVVLDREGMIVDVVVSSAELSADGVAGWIGRKLVDLVTIEGRPKIAELLADAGGEQPGRWRQVTHSLPSGEVPVRYLGIASGERVIAIGRDMRAVAAVQQRLLQAQQSLERDYLRLRQAESRYRLQFDVSDEAVLIVDTATRRIVEANPAAHRLLDAAPGTLARQPATAIAAFGDEEALAAQLGAAGSGPATPATIRLRGGASAMLWATPFRQDRGTYLLVRLSAPDALVAARAGDVALAAAIEKMPDAFVLTDRKLNIIAANGAFLELTHAASAETVVGEPLGNWLGRPGVDLELIGAELRKHGVARNVATILRGAGGLQEEVELAGVMVEAEGAEHHGFVIRSVARRLRDLPPTERDLPRSVEQLTELVGRVSLKEIVRESTDLIERLCIEAALSYTADNRASAAEILGLSRQSLYSKLHRHGLGNLVE